ncbi:MAG: hypothetical protein ACR2JO_07845 [Mycobacteriales bacterium]
MRMFRGDLLPDLQITCTDNDAPVDLTTATGIRVIGVTAGKVLFDRAVTGTASGLVTMVWETADTAAPGRVAVEVEVTWPGVRPQTFRPAQVVDIVADYA